MTDAIGNNQANNNPQLSYFNILTSSVGTLFETIPCAFTSISCLAWALSRTTINASTGLVFGVTPLDVHTFSSRSLQSSKKAVLCVVAGTLSPIIGLGSKQLGKRLLEAPKNIPSVLPKSPSKLIESAVTPPTRINMLSKTLFSVMAVPVNLIEGSFYALWTVTRSVVNILTFATVGTTIMDSADSMIKSAKCTTKAALAILTFPATFLITLVSPKESANFYKKFGPGCIQITNYSPPSNASSENPSSSDQSKNDLDNSNTDSQQQDAPAPQTEKSNIPPAPPMEESIIPPAPPMQETPIPPAPPMDESNEPPAPIPPAPPMEESIIPPAPPMDDLPPPPNPNPIAKPKENHSNNLKKELGKAKLRQTANNGSNPTAQKPKPTATNNPLLEEIRRGKTLRHVDQTKKPDNKPAENSLTNYFGNAIAVRYQQMNKYDDNDNNESGTDWNTE